MSFDEPEIYERFEAYRSQVYDGSLNLRDMCRQEGLHLDLNDLRYVSHWITPIGPPKRFDTRFFLIHDQFIHNDPEQVMDASGELNEIHWLTLEKARLLDLPAITRWVIDMVEARIQLAPSRQIRQPASFVHFSQGGPVSEAL